MLDVLGFFAFVLKFQGRKDCGCQRWVQSDFKSLESQTFSAFRNQKAADRLKCILNSFELSKQLNNFQKTLEAFATFQSL